MERNNLKKEIHILDLPEFVINNILKYISKYELYVTIRKVCRKLRMRVDDFLQLMGLFLLTSERGDFDMRLPTQVLYVFEENKSMVSVFLKALPPYPNPTNSYDTDDNFVRHISDIGYFGNILNGDRIVVGVYCKELWTNSKNGSGKKERRLKLRPRLKTNDKENKTTEVNTNHCIYWKKNEGLQSTPQDQSKAMIYLSNRNENIQEETDVLYQDEKENDVAESTNDSPSIIKHKGGKYVLVPYLYEHDLTSNKWLPIELSAIHPIIYDGEVQCSLGFCLQEHSIFVELNVQIEGFQDHQTVFVRFSQVQGSGLKQTFEYVLGGVDDLFEYDSLNPLVNRRWWDQGIFRIYNNENLLSATTLNSRRNYELIPRHFFRLKHHVYFVKDYCLGLNIVKYCPKNEKFRKPVYRLPSNVSHVEKVLTDEMESFAILIVSLRKITDLTSSDRRILIFTEREGIKDVGINLSHFCSKSSILLRIR